MSNLAWINVKDYGATGNGSTDDTTAINAAIAQLNANARGVLYFPTGSYKVTAALTTITVPATILGDGMGNVEAASGTYISTILCTSATAVLFTITSAYAKFSDITILNTSGSASAGAGIQCSSANQKAKVDFDAVFVGSFYVCVDIQVGLVWTMRSSMLTGGVAYCLKIANTLNVDAGLWSISDCLINGTAVGIHQASSGGGKITNSTFESCTNAYQFIGAGATSELIVSSSTFESYSGDAIHVDANGTGFLNVIVSSCLFAQYANTGHAVYTTGVNDVSISGCTFLATGGAATAISLNNGTHGYVGPMVNSGFSTRLATSSFTDLLDHSNS